MKEALFYKKLKKDIIQCKLCPHFCTLKNNEMGKCRVRKNINGILYSLSYEKPISMHIDPIEKKPLYNFLPGTAIFSMGMAGCNLRCANCQNWEISQQSGEDINVQKITADEIIKMTKKSECPSIAYTYTEPLVSYEYIIEIAKLAKKVKIKNVLVSNGYINEGPLQKLCKYLDGANIDLKSISDDFYKKICQASVSPVLNSLKILKENDVWVEITNLLIPTLNDHKESIKNLVDWIKENLGKDTPLHFSAFYPCYKLMNLSPTPPETLRKAKEIASNAGLRYVYLGNIHDEENNTYCKKCSNLLIERNYYNIKFHNFKNGKCLNCNAKILGIWK